MRQCGLPKVSPIVCVLLLAFFSSVAHLVWVHDALPELPRDYWPPEGTGEGPRILFLCIIERAKAAEWVRAVPAHWWTEMERVGRLMFVVGGAGDAAAPPLPPLPDGRNASAAYLELPVRDNEYPPIGKELHVYEALVRRGMTRRFAFALKFDSDTVVAPARLARLIAHNNWTASQLLYAGGPLHHCDCTFDGQPVCAAESGIHYCSGAAVLTSARTVERLARRSAECYAPPAGEFSASCASSDTWLGWCMNRLVGVRCTAARSGDPLPPRGKSFYVPVADGAADEGGGVRKSVVRHHVCQDMSSVGGVKERDRLPRSWLFSRPDFAYCATLHALKFCEDRRYAFYNLRYLDERPASAALPHRGCGRCLLAVHVREADGAEPTLVQDAALEWPRFAAELGVVVVRVAADAPAAVSECAFHVLLPGALYLRLLPLIHALRDPRSPPLPRFVVRAADLSKTLPRFADGGAAESTWAQSMVVERANCSSSALLLRPRSQADLRDLFRNDLDGSVCREAPPIAIG